MSRQPTADDGREEAYDDRGVAGGAADGVIIREHRYAPGREQVSEERAERIAQSEAHQDAADAGRNPWRLPWDREARNRLKVRHRAWERMPNGWFRCKRCSFPAFDDPSRIAHQEEHRERERVLRLQSDDRDELKAEITDLREQLNLMADEVAHDRYRFTALCLALGKPDEEAMHEAVDFVLSYAREVNARRED